MADPKLIEAVRHSPLAPDLSDEELNTLAENLAFRDLEAGEVLIHEGASDQHLYVIVKGTLALTKSHETADKLTLFTLSAGEFVGELSFLDDTRHYASVVALVPTRVFSLGRDRLEALLTTQPEIVYHVMRSIVRTVHAIQRKISIQSTELANYIYKQHGRY